MSRVLSNYQMRHLMIPGHWRQPLLVLCLALVTLLVIYAETVAETAAMWWRSDTYAHGMLIIPFAIYMIWSQRARLTTCLPSMSWLGIALMLPGILFWVIGYAVNVLVIQQLALLWLIWSIILAVLGLQVVRAILFPLAFLFFAVPLGEGLIPLLMDFTAVFTIKALQLTGIPVFWEGLYFTIPSGNFEVAKACSGVRYLFASVALGCLFAYLNYRSMWRRSLFIGISIILPIIANGLRAYGIVMLAHLSDMRLAVGVDHIIYGWLFFGIIMFVLFFIGAKWREPRADDASVVERSKKQNSTHSNGYVRPAHIGGLLGMLTTALILEVLAAPEEMKTLHATQIEAPAGQYGWRLSADELAGWHISFRGATKQFSRMYVRDDAIVGLFVAYYQQETQHAELISAINTLYDVKHWTRIGESSREIQLADGVLLNIKQIVLRSSGNQRRLLWSWYDIGGTTISDIYLGKLLQAWQKITGQAQPNAVLALMVDFTEEDQKNALGTIEEYLHDMYPAISTQLQTARALSQGMGN